MPTAGIGSYGVSVSSGKQNAAGRNGRVRVMPYAARTRTMACGTREPAKLPAIVLRYGEQGARIIFIQGIYGSSLLSRAYVGDVG